MARLWRGVRSRPVGAAVVFLLAAVAGVVGNQLTGHLTVALVVFAVLVVAGMTVTFLLERQAGGRTSAEGQGASGARGAIDLPGARAGKYDVQVHGGQGVQVGDHNTQTNTFGAPPGS